MTPEAQLRLIDQLPALIIALTALVAAVVTAWRGNVKAAESAVVVDGKLDQIHAVVNSKSDAMVAEIKRLNEVVQSMSASKATAVAELRAESNLKTSLEEAK